MLNGVRAYRDDCQDQPRWGRLYAALGVVAAVGLTAHFAVSDALLVGLVDTAFALALFIALVGWVHLNRVALTRADEPRATVRPNLRLVRGTRRAEDAYRDDGVVRLDPDERVILPYSFL
jgi:hypothetical protein